MKIILNGSSIRSRAELYDALEALLDAPAWFGRNLDAVHDLLLHEILPGGTLTVEIADAGALRENLGRYAEGLIRMLTDVAAEDERLTLIVR